MAVEPDNSPILCFQHCQAGVNILCIELPDSCPVCNASLISTPMAIPPFRLPSPFVHSKEATHSIVIRPTNGSFLRDYSDSADLHVGISDLNGAVYDYSQHGIKKHPEGWNSCLAAEVTEVTDKFRGLWDPKLNEFTAYSEWDSDKYSEKEHSCYNFALGFLQFLGMQSVIPSIKSKSDFCDHMILPLAVKAKKYISLHRHLLQNGAMVQYDTEL